MFTIDKDHQSSDDYYLSAGADQPGALVLPLTPCLSLLGCSTEADGQAAGGRAHLEADSFIWQPLFSVVVVELPTMGGWLVGQSCRTCFQLSTTSFLPNQPLIVGPGENRKVRGIFSPVQQVVVLAWYLL